MTHRLCDGCDCELFDVESEPRGAFALLGDDTEFSRACAAMCERWGFARVSNPAEALFAIAPLLTRKIPRSTWSAPRLGTLIFHPSALPYRRGPDAIRHTVEARERVSAATWFWCDDGLDSGPVCAQEVVVLRPGESPGRAYHTRFCPAGLRALERALAQIACGVPARIEQDHTLSTYDPRLPLRGALEQGGSTGATPAGKAQAEANPAPVGAIVQAAMFGGEDPPPELAPLVSSMR